MRGGICLSRGRAAQEYESKDFSELNKCLDELVGLVHECTNDGINLESQAQIQSLLFKMSTISKKIGGSVFEHVRDLKLDINAFLSNPETRGLTLKIFQDFQLLKNELRRL